MSFDYSRYLASREWAVKKRQVMARAERMCERCHRAKAKQVHHLTYDHIGNEPLEDLQAVCSGCHEFLSAVTDVDPASVDLKAAVNESIDAAIATMPVRLIDLQPRLREILSEMRAATAARDEARLVVLMEENDRLCRETWRKYGRPA